MDVVEHCAPRTSTRCRSFSGQCLTWKNERFNEFPRAVKNVIVLNDPVRSFVSVPRLRCCNSPDPPEMDAVASFTHPLKKKNKAEWILVQSHLWPTGFLRAHRWSPWRYCLSQTSLYFNVRDSLCLSVKPFCDKLSFKFSIAETQPPLRPICLLSALFPYVPADRRSCSLEMHKVIDSFFLTGLM